MSRAEINVYEGVDLSNNVNAQDQRVLYNPSVNPDELEPVAENDQKGRLIRVGDTDKGYPSWETVLTDRKIWVAHHRTEDLIVINEFPIIKRTGGNPVFGPDAIRTTAIKPGEEHQVSGKRTYQVSKNRYIRRNMFIAVRHLPV